MEECFRSLESRTYPIIQTLRFVSAGILRRGSIDDTFALLLASVMVFEFCTFFGIFRTQTMEYPRHLFVLVAEGLVLLCAIPALVSILLEVVGAKRVCDRYMLGSNTPGKLIIRCAVTSVVLVVVCVLQHAYDTLRVLPLAAIAPHVVWLLASSYFSLESWIFMVAAGRENHC